MHGTPQKHPQPLTLESSERIDNHAKQLEDLEPKPSQARKKPDSGIL